MTSKAKPTNKTMTKTTTRSTKSTSPSKRTTAKTVAAATKRVKTIAAKPSVAIAPQKKVATKPVAGQQTKPVEVMPISIINYNPTVGTGLSTARQLQLGIRLSERTFIDQFEGTEFSMQLGGTYGQLLFQSNDEGRWGMYYRQPGVAVPFHIEMMEPEVMAYVGSRLQDFWSEGKNMQRANLENVASSIARLGDFLGGHRTTIGTYQRPVESAAQTSSRRSSHRSSRAVAPQLPSASA